VFPLVREMAAVGARFRVPVAVACRVLGRSTQGYYQWLKQPVRPRDWDDAHLINAAVDIHADDPGYGYRFIADELAQTGIVASENRVWRLCSAQRIFSAHSKKRGSGRKPGPPVHDDLLRVVDPSGRPGRDFTAARPDEKWLTDISEHPTGEGKLYLCAVKDCYSGRIVGLLDRLANEVFPRRLRDPQRHQPPLARRHDPAFRQGQPVPIQEGRAAAEEQRSARVDGPSRSMRGQRRHGVVLRPVTKECPEHQTVAHPRGTPPRDRHLDRVPLQPTPPATTPRPTHPRRV